MLHARLNLCASSLLTVALAAGALFALPAAAETACDPSDGYGQGLVSYVGEIEACLAASDAFDAETEASIIQRTNEKRTVAGLNPLNRRDSLDAAARAHALDMAARNYAGHNDLEGRGHIHRMRALDRQALAGATGANVVVLDAGVDVEGIHETIRSDAANAANLTRDSFTDTGVGIAEANGLLYVVQMLVTVDGELERPMPLQIAGATSFTPAMSQDYFRTAGWTLSDESGSRLAGGQLMRLQHSAFKADETGYLDVLAELDTDTYVLKGPLVTRR
jgi:uncharacterized protein YkwD